MKQEVIIYHLLPHPKGWCLMKRESSRLSRIVSTKREGEKIGNRLIKRYKKSRLFIHNSTGMIIDFIDHER